MPCEAPQELDLLSEEFTEYQLLQDTDISRDIWEKATVLVDEGHTYHRMDVLWHHFSSMKAVDNLSFSTALKGSQAGINNTTF